MAEDKTWEGLDPGGRGGVEGMAIEHQNAPEARVKTGIETMQTYQESHIFRVKPKKDRSDR